MTPEQIQRLLTEPLYSWDVSALLSGIVDYLAFSEQNLASQREQEVQRAREEADAMDALEFGPENADLVPQARKQIVESAELHFDIVLSQSVRYGGIVAYVTSVEWCMKLFAGRLVLPAPKKPERTNQAVHVLEHLNKLVAVPLSEQASKLQRIVTVRNCIVHAAGLLNEYKYGAAEVRTAITGLNGFSVSNAGWMGDTVHVAAGAVDQLAREALDWIPALDKECSTNGAFK